MPISQAPDLSDDKAEVEHTIMPWCITVPTVPIAGPAQPWHSGRISHIPGYYRQLVGENDNAEHLDYVYSAEHDDIITEAITDVDIDPKTLNKAQSRNDWSKWREVMDKEMATLEHAGTWCMVPHPQNKNIVRSKWVYCIKCKADGSIDKY
jgi:hypothetical protein